MGVSFACTATQCLELLEHACLRTRVTPETAPTFTHPSPFVDAGCTVKGKVAGDLQYFVNIFSVTYKEDLAHEGVVPLTHLPVLACMRACVYACLRVCVPACMRACVYAYTRSAVALPCSRSHALLPCHILRVRLPS